MISSFLSIFYATHPNHIPGQMKSLVSSEDQGSVWASRKLSCVHSDPTMLGKTSFVYGIADCDPFGEIRAFWSQRSPSTQDANDPGSHTPVSQGRGMDSCSVSGLFTNLTDLWTGLPGKAMVLCQLNDRHNFNCKIQLLETQ